MSKGLESLNKLQHDLDHKLKGDELTKCFKNIYYELKALEVIKEYFCVYFIEKTPSAPEFYDNFVIADQKYYYIQVKAYVYPNDFETLKEAFRNE